MKNKPKDFLFLVKDPRGDTSGVSRETKRPHSLNSEVTHPCPTGTTAKAPTTASPTAHGSTK
ncbi:hypothetical protein FACS18949_07630 [Clostridia bacterium]|nr:hypothetical protein FACS18949_07630 [Clostridia bacterium]